MFRDRREAGRRLAERLLTYRNDKPVVLALPRGGVPVAAEVAQALDAPLDVLVVRKLGAPGQPELGIGAVVDGDHPRTVVNEEIASALGVSEEYLLREIRSQLTEVDRRQTAYRQGRPALDVSDRTAIVVDDGIATGGTVRAALRGVRRLGPRRVVLAVPVAPIETLEALRAECDDVVCLHAPMTFYAIGEFYRDFGQTSDAEVVKLLADARARTEKETPARAD
jgi:putative phosphoribosyl transferase